MTRMFPSLARVFPVGDEPRSRRTSRRFSPGLAGLEGRLSPSSLPVLTVTISNDPPAPTGGTTTTLSQTAVWMAANMAPTTTMRV
jgi:hypothetical protein